MTNIAQTVLEINSVTKKKLKKKPIAVYAPTTMDAKCAQMIRNKALVQLKSDARAWLHDTEMSKMISEDFIDHLTIADTLLRFGPGKASTLVYDLDTNSRETIPDTAYNHIMKY